MVAIDDEIMKYVAFAIVRKKSKLNHDLVDDDVFYDILIADLHNFILDNNLKSKQKLVVDKAWLIHVDNPNLSNSEIIKKLNVKEFAQDSDYRFYPYTVNNTYYGSLFDDGFNMEKAIESVPDIEKRANAVIADIHKSPEEKLGKWESETSFENLCMDVIESIVKMNREWVRQDAIFESARELVAVKYTFQGKQACDVHTRVLREFMIATDDEYNLLRQQLWGMK